MTAKNWVRVLVTVFTGVLTTLAYAEEKMGADYSKHHGKTGMMKEVTPEMRKKMADSHQMMADCLKSDKPLSECKQEMVKNCPMMKENGRCAMMGEMDMMMGKHSKTSKAESMEKHETEEKHE